jgi:uncharacterized protein
MRLYRYVVPGLVIQAVMVGGGYATGRELVEFFLSKGPATGVAGLALTALWMSAAAVVSFALARQFGAFDYRSFCRTFLGRFWVLFELGYYALLLLILSVLSAASGKLLAQMFGWPTLVNSILFMAAVAFVVFFGNKVIEKVISAWAIIFYATYGAMFVLVVWRFSGQLHAALASQPLDFMAAVRDSLSYTGYNVVILPILIFVARNFESRREALIAGVVAGPLILIPGLAALLALATFYPGIVSEPLPISTVLTNVGNPTLTMCVQIVILGAFIKTGVGLLHGLNERVAGAALDRGRTIPAYLRPALSIAIMALTVFVAASIGIIDLIGRGYRYTSYFFLLVFFIPLLTRGTWLLMRGRVPLARGRVLLVVPLLALWMTVIPQQTMAQQATAQQSPAPADTTSNLEQQLAKLPRSRRETLLASNGALPGPDFSLLFDKQVVDIRMRDGITLHTEIYTPKQHPGALPIIYDRTPYGLSPDARGFSAHLRMYPELIADGYIFALQDSRGTGASRGEFVTGGPMRDKSLPHSTDQSTDAYDTIDWLVKNVPHNNGRVGTVGISYGGFLVTRALVDPHPALKAASPQATCADMFVGDDWHHNGAFRLSYSFDWIDAMEEQRKGGNSAASASLTRYDSYEQFLVLGPLSNVNKRLFQGRAPSWNAFSEHPNLDSFWSEEMCGVLPFVQPVTIPTLLVVGYFDAEDFYGPLELYQKYAAQDPRHLLNLVMGPWYHGGWSRSPDGRLLGSVDFGSNTSRWYRDNVQARWFGHWLKDEPAPDLPPVLAFRTGANRWESYDSWPPHAGIETRNLYLHADGSLSFVAPTDSGGHDDYVSDPAKPVPYYPRPITADVWPEWELADQRFVDGRPDVLSYVSEPLREDLTVSGDPIANLFAATTGTDSDWIVKLIDVYPEGYAADPTMSGFELMVAGEVFRARYRNSFASPAPLVAGQVTPYAIHLRDRDHTFKQGHRVMVQIQSTWFPVIDRNPQHYVPNIYQAVQSDFRPARQSVYRSARYPSHLALPIATQPAAPPRLPDLPQ